VTSPPPGPSTETASSPSAGTKPSFRPDVQGLRAIAVLTVIAGHAGLPFLPGGFVGVDVFFVISGFLISSLLFREVDRDGQVSLRDFYARRARRILPAATLVTVVTVGASLLWISVVDALSVVTDAVWATFFAANVRFAAVGTDYFAQEEGPSPLQHYWSLAVEEQFYVVWPLLLIGLVALARWRRARTGPTPGRGSRAARRSLPRLDVFGLLVVAGVASFAYGVWLTATQPAAAYFSTPGRAWELAIGAAAALVAPAVAGRLTNAVRGALMLAGLGAIAVACLAYDSSTPFPGVAAALPVLGAAATLVAGAAGAPDAQPWPIRMLGIRPMRVVGDWSFSLYLWHWPLLTIPELRGGDRSLPVTVLAVVLTFVLAGLTYRFVETPFRSARRVPRVRALLLYPVSVVTVVAVALAGSAYGKYQAGEFGDDPAITVANSGIEDAGGVRVSADPTVALVQASVYAARRDDPVPSNLTPDLLTLRDDIPDVGDCDYKDDSVRRLCPRGDPDGDKTLVVLGNSHGRMWIPAFERLAQRDGYRTYYLVKPNCTAADLLVSDLDNGNRPWQACSDFRDWAISQIDDLDPDLVVLSSSGPNPVIYPDGPSGRGVESDDADRLDVTEQGWEDAIARITPLTDRLVLLRDVPKNPGDPGTCLTTGDPDLGTCLFDPMPSQEDDSDASVAAAEATGTDHVDPSRWICWDGSCPVVVGDTLTYRDRGHLTTVYAASLADELARAMDL